MYFGVLNFYNHLLIFSRDSVRLPYILSGVVWMFVPQRDILYILSPKLARVTHASLLCFLTSLSSALCVLNFKGAGNPISALWLYHGPIHLTWSLVVSVSFHMLSIKDRSHRGGQTPNIQHLSLLVGCWKLPSCCPFATHILSCWALPRLLCFSTLNDLQLHGPTFKSNGI